MRPVGLKIEAEAENRGGVPRKGTGSPSPPARGSGKRCKLPSGVSGEPPIAQRLSTISSIPDGLS